MTSAIIVIIVLGGIIFFHELGHFIFAKLFNVGVKAFSLGFGPKVFGVKKGQTVYKLSAIPLGGYVSMVGEQAGEELPEGFTPDQNFETKPAWQRMCIVAAGPVFNFLLAFLIFWFLMAANGHNKLLPVVGGIQADSPAMQVGLKEGDRIVSIDGKPVKFWEDFAVVISESEGRSLHLGIDRNGTRLEKDIIPAMRTGKNIFGETVSRPLIGIRSSTQTEKVRYGMGTAFVQAGIQTWHMVDLTVQGIVKLVERIIPLETIGGPIMIAQMVSEQAERGLSEVLALAALISINLGLINLLPIPVLDGGHILFFAIETVIRRPISEKIRGIALRVGISLLLLLMGLAIYNDVQRLITQ
jgi:regulator of sigma E protease